MKTYPSSTLQKLAKLLQPSEISFDPDVLEAHRGDKWFAAETPEVVVFPKDTQSVSKIFTFANEHRIPVTPRGAGFGYVGGCVPLRHGIALSMMHMNRILEINPADAVAVVQPGVITADIADAVKKYGFFYPPDPASLRDCSIGGNIATNAGGPRCLKYGVTRNYILGLELVLPNGDIARVGGRTHKNKTGFDFVGLMVGSEGLLAVVTEATLRLIPFPPERAVVSAGFPSIAVAARAVQEVFAAGYLPSALEIADAFTLKAARNFLGADLVPEGDAYLLLEIDGQPDSVKSEIKQLRNLIANIGGTKPKIALGNDACEELWKLRRQFSQSLRSTGFTKLNEDITVPRGRLVDLVHFAEELQKEYGYPVACFGHAGDGNIHVNIMTDTNYGDLRTQKILDKLFEKILQWNGVISGEHGIGIAKKRWWPNAVSPETMKLHQTVKQALDPNGILNPGKFVS